MKYKTNVMLTSLFSLLCCFAIVAMNNEVAKSQTKTYKFTPIPEQEKELPVFLAEVIKMLKAGENEKFLQCCVNPKDLEPVLKDITFDQFIEGFANNAAAGLLKTLESIKEKEPEYNKERTTARFEVADTEASSKKAYINFQKIEKRWVLNNTKQ